MGYYRGPVIPLDNLVLALDAGSTRSYPGTGAKWYDISNSQISFSSNGTQTPHTTVSGVPCMDFNGSGYWSSDSNHDRVDLGGDMTLIFWVYKESFATRKTLFQKNGTSYQSYEQELAITWEVADGLSYYSRYGTYDYGTVPVLTASTWSMFAIRLNTGKTTASRDGHYSVNGGNWTSSYTSRSSNTIVPSSTIIVGSGYAGVMDACYLSAVYAYEKEFTNSEISQFYNATKIKHGH
jgi:hypothetical protein